MAVELVSPNQFPPKAFLALIDEDGDGAVDFAEFEAMLAAARDMVPVRGRGREKKTRFQTNQLKGPRSRID